MAESADDLRAQLDRLRKARAGGEKRVRIWAGEGGQDVEFKSDDEMAAAIADLEHRIAVATGGGQRTIRFHTSKGL